MSQVPVSVTARELSALSRSRVLITGAAGMLGAAVEEALARLVPDCHVAGFSHADLDVVNRDAVLALRRQSPDIIVHCAAQTRADICETRTEACHAVQVQGTLNVAALASACGARIVYPQSFLIFDGREEADERTPPAPLSAYGRAKLEAERRLLDVAPESLVVRMGGFFGGHHKDKNFVGGFVVSLIDAIGRGERACSVGNRVWQPSYTRDLAANTLLLLASGRTGVYHMASHGEATFHQVATAVVDELGLGDRVTVNHLSNAERARLEVAPRPERAVLINGRLIREGLDRQRSWREALAEYLASSYFRHLVQNIVATSR